MKQVVVVDAKGVKVEKGFLLPSDNDKAASLVARESDELAQEDAHCWREDGWRGWEE